MSNSIPLRTVVLGAALFASSALAVAPANISQAIDEDAVRDLTARQVEAWNAGDLEAWADAFAPDADYTDWRGASAHGRESIRALQVREPYVARGTARVTRVQVRFPGKDVATVQQQISDAVTRNDDKTSEQRRYSTLIVLKKESGRWSIDAMQSVRLSPAADPGPSR